MFTTKTNDVVTLRDGRRILVTDAADSDPAAYETYHEVNGELRLYDKLPVETIFVGVDANDKTHVSDMSEIVVVEIGGML